MLEVFSASHIRDLFLAEQRGVRYSNFAPKKTVTSANMEAEIGLDEDPLGVKIKSGIVVRVVGDDGENDEPLFEAEVVLYVRLKPDSPQPEGPEIAVMTWPYLRSALMDQAHRMGVAAVKLPPYLDPATLPEPDYVQGDGATAL